MSALPDLLRPLWVAGSGAGEVGTGDRQALDFRSPGDNLYAFGKLWAGYDEPVFSAFHGLMFGRVGSDRLRPLFGYCGFGNFQARLLDNGNVRLRGKEVGLFSGPGSGAILERWDNPYTGERVPVFNFLNDRIRGELTPETG